MRTFFVSGLRIYRRELLTPEEPLAAQAAAYTDDAALAVSLANQAGEVLRSLQREALSAGRDGKWLKDEGDRRSQSFLSSELTKSRPNDEVLSEEATDDSARLHAERVWIIDPLDGTREFSEGREDWAVHVALWSQGNLVAGAVALPGLGMVLDSTSAALPLPVLSDRVPRIAVSRSRPPEMVNVIAEMLGAELVPMGSAGYKVSAVARGEVDAYVHAGGQYEWDSAAPVAVALDWGLHASRIDGSPLLYNRADPYLPDLLVCRQDLAEPLLAAIGQAS